jgi:hypothetical protein
MGVFNLKKLKYVEAKVEYEVNISNRFSALENLDGGVDINSAWRTIRENTRILESRVLRTEAA